MTGLWRYYPHEGEPKREELTEKEDWCWIAEYNDGTILKQFDDEFYYHYFREIDQTKLARFTMVHDYLNPITIKFRPGCKLIHYHTTVGWGVGDQTARYRYPCFGYEGIAEGKQEEIKCLICIMPDGRTIVTDDSTSIKFEFIDGEVRYEC